jgi:hypothetical protein
MSAVTAEQRVEMVGMVKEILGPEKSLLWWTTPNPMFGMIAPMWLCAGPSEHRVRAFIMDAYENNKASTSAGESHT